MSHKPRNLHGIQQTDKTSQSGTYFHWSYVGKGEGKSEGCNQKYLGNSLLTPSSGMSRHLYSSVPHKAFYSTKLVLYLIYLAENAYLVSKVKNKIPRRQTWDTKKESNYYSSTTSRDINLPLATIFQGKGTHIMHSMWTQLLQQQNSYKFSLLSESMSYIYNGDNNNVNSHTLSYSCWLLQSIMGMFK